ncbi:40s ribosomal protein s14p s29e [Vairimorpha apis BRL 01]|uniref:40s ribosomal protein s14p s29e n=1 Tax=Vairimorpha apis BRL 01 TaxID=1037528 RepID=T0KY23_9MICR|nr:40s ribosomal protein s14p s29e [Vairimorpha apis BRL 01]
MNFEELCDIPIKKGETFGPFSHKIATNEDSKRCRACKRFREYAADIGFNVYD